MTKYLPLSNSDRMAAVDDDVYEWASRWKWKALGGTGGKAYAARSQGTRHGAGTKRTWRTIYLHRAVMLGHTLPGGDGYEVDHINGDTFDNRRENLRFATKSQQQQNTPAERAYGRSGRRNVRWSAQKGRWQVALKVNQRDIHYGFFSDLEEAARVAERARSEHFTHRRAA